MMFAQPQMPMMPMAPPIQPAMPNLPPQIVQLLLEMVAKQRPAAPSMPGLLAAKAPAPSYNTPDPMKSHDQHATGPGGNIPYATGFSQSSTGKAPMIDPTKRGYNREEQPGVQRASLWDKF